MLILDSNLESIILIKIVLKGNWFKNKFWSVKLGFEFKLGGKKIIFLKVKIFYIWVIDMIFIFYLFVG